jgi:hypothetical protein
MARSEEFYKTLVTTSLLPVKLRLSSGRPPTHIRPNASLPWVNFFAPPKDLPPGGFLSVTFGIGNVGLGSRP